MTSTYFDHAQSTPPGSAVCYRPFTALEKIQARQKHDQSLRKNKSEMFLRFSGSDPNLQNMQ